jgi:hypothetical protein
MGYSRKQRSILTFQLNITVNIGMIDYNDLFEREALTRSHTFHCLHDFILVHHHQ